MELILAAALMGQPNTIQDIVVQAALRHHVDPQLYLAIVQQESNFQVNAYNSKSQDYGLSQINIATARAYHFNLKRLLQDPVYSANAGAIVLRDIMNRHRYSEPLTGWCRYNVGSGPMVGSKAGRCLVYMNKVMKHYKRGTYVARQEI